MSQEPKPKPKRRPRPWGSIRSRGDRSGFVVRFSAEGRVVERVGGATRAAAEKKRRAARAMLEAGHKLVDVMAHVWGDVGGSGATLCDLAPNYLAFAEARKKESTLKSDVHRLGKLKTAPWAAKPLGAVTPRDVLAWTATREAAGVSGATINRDLALASAIYRWAERAGDVTGLNPFLKVPRYSEKGREREIYLTAPEARALVDSCPGPLRPLVLAAVNTGMRRGELLALRWRSVDLARRVLVVEPATEKTGRGRTIPLSDPLFETLRALESARIGRKPDGSDFVLVGRDGGPWGHEGLRFAFRRAVARCEAIPAAKRSAVTFHTLRHSAASIMVAGSVPLLDVARILGHSTLAMTMRYAHHAPESGRAAIARLGAAMAPPRAGQGVGASDAPGLDA